MAAVEHLSSDSAYNKLIHQEDLSIDEHPLDSDPDIQNVSVSVLRPGPDLISHPKALAVGLALLAALLLMLDIGLGVYYSNLTDGQRTLNHISAELTKLRASYVTGGQKRDEARNQLATEIHQQQLSKWELDHQQKRSEDYRNQITKMRGEIVALQSLLPKISEGCRHCLPGWVSVTSKCFYLASSSRSTTWYNARQYCKRQGGDLAIINSKEKQLAISNLIKGLGNPSRPIHLSGFWIGLRDEQEEGTWRWWDGTLLVEGYWNDGEPNDQYQLEDCAAVYPRDNPFKAWNDAPCRHPLQWICEMSQTSLG